MDASFYIFPPNHLFIIFIFISFSHLSIKSPIEELHKCKKFVYNNICRLQSERGRAQSSTFEIQNRHGRTYQGAAIHSNSWFDFLNFTLYISSDSPFLLIFGGLDELGNAARPKLQRYPLRSGSKLKQEKPPVPELSNPPSSASKR